MFEWNDEKNRQNVGKHGVSFDLAVKIFDGIVVTKVDGRRDYGEIREISVGAVNNVLILAVVHTDRRNVTRVTSARRANRAEGNDMTKQYDKALTVEELAALPDESIDYSDVPELDAEFWETAVLIKPEQRQSVTLRIKTSVLDAYKATGKGYQTRMNAVLESYAKTLKS